MTFPILYARGNKQSVLQWQIFVDGPNYWTVAGQVGGKLTTSAPTTSKAKNVGKKNATTPEQQAIVDAQNKFTKKKKENYFENIADIDTGFLEPQLAKPCKDYIEKFDFSGGALLDDKLNGFACVVKNEGAFTRTNEQYHAIPHIVDFYGEMFLKSYPNAYIQGELFNPIYVNELNKIAEIIAVTRQPKDITPELLAESERIVQFHWYDGYGFSHPLTGEMITQNTPLIRRRRAIDAWIKIMGSRYIQSVRYDIVYSAQEAWTKAYEYIEKEKGEGKILKNPSSVYQHKRTKDLLKLKKQESREYQVVNDVENPFEEGTGNSAGCAEAVWVFNPEGTRSDRFKVNIEGPKDRLRDFYLRPQDFKGEWITVRFQELSPYGVPLIPYTDMVIRAKVEGNVNSNFNL